jgi:hypothetical protein
LRCRDGAQASSPHPRPARHSAPQRWGTSDQFPELGKGKKLLHVVEAWLRVEKEARQAAEAAAPPKVESVQPTRTPYMPSKHLAFFR